MIDKVTYLTELYTNSKGATYQCDRSSRITVEFGGYKMAFKINEFLNFKQKVDSVDLHAMIFDLSDESDFEIIEAPQANLSLKLTLCDLVNLRDLLAGAKFMLELNSLLYERIYNVPVYV
ncbi:hypothetical protein [Runella sp.]|uniref:hypothetical protein n=1 Tax=Runella sp. TaxID=1960881 RepID=UPI003D0B6DBC